jgi:hypothetical protein
MTTFLARRAVGVQLLVTLVEARGDLVEQARAGQVDASSGTVISKIGSP